MRRTTVLAGAVIPLVLVLAGCGSDNPKPAPPETSSASPSASPSAVAPTMPAEAKGTGPEAAKAFVKHYLAMFSYAARTGDVSGMRSLAADGCNSCRELTDKIQKVYEDGGSASGRGYKERVLRITESTSSRVVLRGVVIQFAQRSVPSSGASPKTFPRGELQSQFEVVQQAGTWHLKDWSLL